MSPLRAGAAKATITPPCGYTMGAWGLRQGRSTGVHRDLFARALYLDDGSKQAAILSLDIAGMAPEAVKLIRARVERLTGLSPEALLISSTHNHTTPNFITEIPPELGVYTSVFAETSTGAVYQAMHAQEPARVGFGSGNLPGWTCNRQYPREKVDTGVGVMRVDAADGWPIARVVNFACHGVCDGGQYLDWSGDMPGEMSAAVEEWTPGAVGIFLQGAAGDIHPFDWWFGNWKSKHMHTHEEIGRAHV